MSSLTGQDLGQLYRFLLLTRGLEDRCERLLRQQEVGGGLSRSLGQEAIAVGSAYVLERGDWLAPTMRDVGALLVRGLEPRELLLEWDGRASSVCAGRDEAIRVTVPELGLLGPIGSLGTQLCALNGIALAFQLRGEAGVCLGYLGEGATRTGAAHEGLAFAAARRLPLVAVIEHNGWALGTRSGRQAAVAEWTNVAKAYGAAAIGVDGNDVLAVHDATLELVGRARAGRGLGVLVAESYRMAGHDRSGPGDPVAGELEAWRERDPIGRYERYLTEHCFETAEELRAIRSAVDRELDRAVDAALEDPLPDPDAAAGRVYAGAVG